MKAVRSVLLVLLVAPELACSSTGSDTSSSDQRFRSALAQANDSKELLSLILHTSEVETGLEVSLLRHIELVGGGEARRDVEKYLDRCAARLRQILDRDVPETADQLFSVLKSHWLELNIRYLKAASPSMRPALVSQGVCMLRLARRAEGDCLDVSALYLCLAERFNLPLFLVVVPTHGFLRIQMRGRTIIFEGTQPGWGKERKEEDYAQTFGTGEQTVSERSFYFRSLSKREAVLSMVFDEITALWTAAERFEDVLQLCDAVQGVFGPDAFLNKRFGALMCLSADLKLTELRDPVRMRLALKVAERHLELYPSDDLSSFLLLRGIVLLKDGPWSRSAAERALRNQKLSSATRKLALDILKESQPKD